MCISKHGGVGFKATSKKGNTFCRAATAGTRRVRKDKGKTRGHWQVMGVHNGNKVYKSSTGTGYFYINRNGNRTYLGRGHKFRQGGVL